MLLENPEIWAFVYASMKAEMRYSVAVVAAPLDTDWAAKPNVLQTHISILEMWGTQIVVIG